MKRTTKKIVYMVFVSVLIGALMGVAMANAANMVDVDEVYIIKACDKADITVQCANGGAHCSASAVCNITLFYPSNYTIFLNDLPMTNQDTFHNITIEGTKTCKIGDYRGSIVCCDGANCNNADVILRITPSGEDRGTAISLILIFAAIIVILLAFVLKNEYVGFVGGILFIVAGVHIVIYGMLNLSDVYTRTIGITSICLGVIFFIYAAYEGVVNKEEY